MSSTADGFHHVDHVGHVEGRRKELLTTKDTKSTRLVKALQESAFFVSFVPFVVRSSCHYLAMRKFCVFVSPSPIAILIAAGTT